MSAPGRPEGEYLRPQHEVSPVSATARPVAADEETRR